MTANELADRVLTREVAMESADLLMSNLGLVIKALRAYGACKKCDAPNCFCERGADSRPPEGEVGIPLALAKALADGPDSLAVWELRGLLGRSQPQRGEGS